MLSPDKFSVVGYTLEEANRIDRPTISYWQDAWRRLRKNPVAMVSLVVLGILMVMVIIGPNLRGYDYVSMNVSEKNLGSSAKYWFGTDYLGRDLFSRVWVGARVSMLVALVATALKLVVGTLYGAIMAHSAADHPGHDGSGQQYVCPVGGAEHDCLVLHSPAGAGYDQAAQGV